jgi:N4-gp56 family major capsid protein
MATNLSIPTNNAVSDFTSQNATFLPELWKKGVQLSEAAENFFNQFEGPTENYSVMSVRDLSRGAGSKITFRTMAQLYGEGVQGETLINSNTEDFRVGAYNLTVDFLRHAVSYNRRLEEKTALASELKSNVPVMLGNWLGRMKTERLMKLFLHKGNGRNYVFANGKANTDALLSTDTLSYDGIVAYGQQLRTRGARPAQVATIDKNKLNRYVVVSTGEGLLSLKSETKYLQAINAAGGKEGYNGVAFTGGFVDLDGHIIRQFDPVDHDGFGAIGSPLNAKATLGTAITATTGSAITVRATLSDSTKPGYGASYFKYFSGYSYPFSADDADNKILGTTTTSGYVLILNLTGSDAGKYGFYSYSANNGNTLTLNRGLVATTGSVGSSGDFQLKTTVGGVTSVTTPTTSPWHNDKLTNTHPVGSLVIETNSRGVAIGRSLVLGAMAAVRGYGSLDGERSEETFDGDFVRKTYITSIFGQSPYVRPDGDMPNFLVATHAVNYAGLNLPSVTS